MAAAVEDAWSTPLAPGRDEALRYMAHLHEPLRCHYRPLAFYALGEFGAACRHVLLSGYGFRARRHGARRSRRALPPWMLSSPPPLLLGCSCWHCVLALPPSSQPP